MLKYNGEEKRHLVEQVQKNKEDIARHYAIDRSLANFGIKIVGTVTSVDELPNPLTYAGEYGDGYAVGQTGSYEYYIYTRPDINSGHPNNYWLNVGSISIVGPQGIQGPQGEQGPQGKSSKWFTGELAPGNDVNTGDMYLNNQGEVFQYNGTNWVPTTNIKGPQGIQGIQGIKGEKGEQGPVGPQGPQGDVGGFINIWGILSSTSQLPTPTELNNLSVAYLVQHTGGTDQANDHYDLYIQVGATVGEAVWNNVGPFNAATLVTSGGVGLNVFDADTKLDKATDVTTYDQVYGKKTNGTQAQFNVSNSVLWDSIPYRSAVDGTFGVALPKKETDCTNKKYVDDIAATKLDKVTSAGKTRVYTITASGTQSTLSVASAADSGNLAIRTGEGVLKGKTPETGTNDDLINREYFNNKLATVPTEIKYMHNLSIETSDKATMLNLQFMSTSNTPIQTTSELFTAITNFLTTGRYPVSGVVKIETTRYVATYIYIDKGNVYIMGTSGIGTSTIGTNSGLLQNIIYGQYTISDKVF